MSRCLLTYEQRSHVLDLRRTIVPDDVFIEQVKLSYPKIGDKTLTETRLQVWTICCNTARRNHKMTSKKLHKNDYSDEDRTALAHYDSRYAINTLNMTPAQVNQLKANNPKPVINLRSTTVEHQPKPESLEEMVETIQVIELFDSKIDYALYVGLALAVVAIVAFIVFF